VTRSVPPFRPLPTLLPLLALASLVLASASWAQGPVVDDLGREVRLSAPPQRVVSMIPSHTETVCALDACDLLVGVDTFSDHPARVDELPDLGSAFDADLERLIALEPDLVLTDEYSGLAEALAPLGIPVYAGMAERTEEVWEIVAEVAALLDRRAAGALLIGRAEGRVEALAGRAEGESGPRVFVELDATPYSVGPRSYLGQLLRRAGARNVVPAELGDFPQVDPELVIEADPEVILLLDAPFGESLETLAGRPGWAGIDAVRSGRVIELTQDQVDLLTRPGPRLPEALELLLDLLAPEGR
jgi:iron complex transport system substrate-binding protein